MHIKRALLAAVTIAMVVAANGEAARAAPDNTLGMAILSATVASNGTLTHGSGATGSVQNGTGIYMVTFNRDLTGCSGTASAGRSTIGAVHFSIIATADCPATAANDLRVYTRTGLTIGDVINAAFHAIVFCPK